MKAIVAALLLSFAASIADAQSSRGSRGDGADARTDALLGASNKATPVPQANLFSTSPGLEQQAPGPSGKEPPKAPNAPTAGSKP
ncbi:MAG TPA: hypothetical protein VFT77_16300 [Reyranella sp.]|jgi:hypothetical protein|nr:hypothetical protein [Reyranella sp.]